MTQPHRPVKHTTPRVVYRWVSGRPLDGVGKSDSTYAHAGTKATTPHGRAGRWAMRPGYQRQLIRHGTTAGVAFAAYAYTVAPVVTTVAVEAGAAGAGAYYAVRTVRGIRNAGHGRRYVRPLAAVLGPQLGVAPHLRPRDWLTVPPELATGRIDRAGRLYRAGIITARIAELIRADKAWDRLTGPIERKADQVLQRLRQPVAPALDKLSTYLQARRDERRDNAEIIVRLPAGIPLGAELRTAILNAISTKVTDQNLTATWHTYGAAPYVTLRAAPSVPDRVVFADIRDLIEAASESKPIIGLGTGRKAVAVDLDADAPHGLFSMASGAGKSVLIRALAAQLLHNGAQVIVIDAKRVSQSWLKGIPGVIYCRTAEMAHKTLLELAEEVDRRYDLIDMAEPGEEDSVDVGPRIVLLYEEMNAMVGKLNRYWANTRDKDDPKASPAMAAFADIIAMGRQGKVHCLAVAQMGTARTLGGPEVRESFSNRILGRYTMNAWRMLAPEVWPMPKPSTRQGRVQVVLGGTATETQTVFFTTEEARAWAMSGPVHVPTEWSQPFGRGVSPTVRDASDLGGKVSPVPRRDTPPDVRVTLEEASEDQGDAVVPMKYEALRKARQREDFPMGVRRGRSTEYSSAALRMWYANRSNTRTEADAEIEV